MKWPWVPRESLELAVKAADFAAHTADRLTLQCAELRAANAELLDRLFPKPTPEIAPIQQPAREPSVIAQTIRQEAGSDSRLSAYLWKRSRELRTEHPDWASEQIAEQLASWQSTETEGIA